MKLEPGEMGNGQEKPNQLDFGGGEDHHLGPGFFKMSF